MKVLVYGGERNAESTAGILEEEMLLEVKKITSIRNFTEMSAAEIMEETEKELSLTARGEELIVLADPLGSALVGRELKRRHPGRKIICYGQGVTKGLRRMRAVYVLATEKVRRSEWYQRMKAACQRTVIREHSGRGWREVVEQKRTDKIEIMEKVKSAQGAPIVVLHPEMAAGRVKEVVDWRNDVVDLEKTLVKKAKTMLGRKNWL